MTEDSRIRRPLSKCARREGGERRLTSASALWKWAYKRRATATWARWESFQLGVYIYNMKDQI